MKKIVTILMVIHLATMAGYAQTDSAEMEVSTHTENILLSYDKIIFDRPLKQSDEINKRFEDAVTNYWGSTLKYELVDDVKGVDIGPRTLKAYQGTKFFYIRGEGYSLKIFCGEYHSFAEWVYIMGRARYEILNHENELNTLNRLKEKILLVSLESMNASTDEKKQKWLDKQLSAYPYKYKVVAQEEIEKAIINQEDILVTWVIYVPDTSTSASIPYYCVYDPTDGALISMTRQVFHTKSILKGKKSAK